MPGWVFLSTNLFLQFNTQTTSLLIDLLKMQICILRKLKVVVSKFIEDASLPEYAYLLN